MARSSAMLVPVTLLATTRRSLCSRGPSRSETCARHVRRLTNRCAAFALTMGFATLSTARRYPQNAPPAHHVIGQSFRDCQTYCPEMVILPPGKFPIGSPMNEVGRGTDENPQKS
jgi:putative heme iron utilization protein